MKPFRLTVEIGPIPDGVSRHRLVEETLKRWLARYPDGPPSPQGTFEAAIPECDEPRGYSHAPRPDMLTHSVILRWDAL